MGHGCILERMNQFLPIALGGNGNNGLSDEARNPLFLVINL